MSLMPETSLEGRFCARPFEHLEVMHGQSVDGISDKDFGQTYACCASWLPVAVGNLNEQSVQDVFNSEALQKIRKSIHDGNFKYCDHKVCPRIQGGTLPLKTSVRDPYFKDIIENKKVVIAKPRHMLLCYDRSCNLACPSCRKSHLLLTGKAGYDKVEKLTDKIIESLFSAPHKDFIRILISGSGDPFVSKSFFRFVEKVDPGLFPNLKITLFTNGVLLTKELWNRISKLHSAIDEISVSIDAATASTYQKVRGGSFEQLQSNLEFIGELRVQKKIKYFSTNFVVQTANYQEAPEFVDFCTSKNVDDINFSFISDWKTWSPEEFAEQCIWRTDHPELPKFIEVMRDPRFNHKAVRLGPLTAYQNLKDIKRPLKERLMQPLRSVLEIVF